LALHVIDGWRTLPPELKGAAVALGAFDGVHRGHRQVIAEAAKAAAALNAPLGAISFEPHPRRYFGRETEPFRLMTTDQQARALDELGVERFYILTFDQEFAAFTDEAFAKLVLVEGLGVRHVAAGFDISFGAGRTGSPERLKQFGDRYGFSVSIAEPVIGAKAEKFSSSMIREALRDGHPEVATDILGRPFAIEGVVEHGDKLGRTIGFPTANIPLGDYLRPKFGIYATRTRLADGREVAGVSYVGPRPIVNGTEERLEVHLFDFDEDIYGETLETYFIRYLRGDANFDSWDDMLAQIKRDAAAARAILLPSF
jgi:riboflavin kinase/FMN adenylyltransferase